jgi:DnaD/phage-associated family protein
MVDIAVIDDEEHLDIYDKMIFMILNRHAGNEDGKAWPSRKTIAKKARCSVDRVDKSIKRLKELELLKVEKRTNPDGSPSSNLYQIPPVVMEIGGSRSDRLGWSPESARVADEIGGGSRPERDELNTSNYTQLTNNNNKEKSEKKINVFDMYHQVFGRFPNTFQIEDLNFYLGNGMDEDLLVHGLNLTAKRGMHFGYTAKIYDNWLDKKIMTLKQAEEESNSKQQKGEKKNDIDKGHNRSELYW